MRFCGDGGICDWNESGADFGSEGCGDAGFGVEVESKPAPSEAEGAAPNGRSVAESVLAVAVTPAAEADGDAVA